MRKAMSITLMLVLALSVNAFARPVDEAGSLDKFMYLDLSGQKSDLVGTSSTGVFGAAQADTTFYGGTYWAADSSRWEALEDSVWTFDTGVGSDIVGSSSNPYVDPNKLAGLHATMEGWTGFDNSFSLIDYFRRVTDTDPRWGADVCVGAGAGLGGSASYWCGVFPEEADALCYATGQGYGNAWVVCIRKLFAFAGGGVTLDFDYVAESEPGFDFSQVVIDTAGLGNQGDEIVVSQYDGVSSGHESLSLSPGVELPTAGGGNVYVKFCFQSDGAWSDEDGLHVTTCGAFAVDNVTLAGGIVDGPSTFETGDDGWTLAPPQPGQGGEWSNIVDWQTDLPAPLTPCDCALVDSVLVFDDLSLGTGHNEFSDNLAASPWIDLGPDGWNNTGPGKVIETKIYAELPLLNYIFVQFNIQWYPDVCLNTGKILRSPWTSNGFVYYFGGVPQCTTLDALRGTQIDFSSFVPPGAEQIRIALGMLSYCRFFANCTGVSNSTPWLDQIKLGVYGDPNAPLIASRSIDIPQDSFPQNGTLSIVAPGRIDCNNILGATSPETGTAMGDTLVVQGGGGGAEVYAQFSISPGPGVDPVALSDFLMTVTFEETKDGLDWYSAQMDTAEQGGSGANVGSWMTTRIEGSPGFAGTDRDFDPSDLDAFGRQGHLLNDFLPDNLLTAGSRLNLFYKTRFVGGASWYVLPDTTDANYFEMEVLPSSMAADSTFNCILYVDHFNRGAQVFIEDALTLFVGAGNNYEGTGWDRYDVNAESSQQGSVGRPGYAPGQIAPTPYGAEWDQIIGYDCIVWNSGNLNAFNLTKEDGDILIPWISLSEFDFKNFYGSGDGLVNSAIGEAASEPSARRFLNDYCGVTFTCNTYRDLDCPTDKPQDITACVNIDPVAGAYVANNPVRLEDHVGQGNGCPQQRSFDVLGVNPSPDFGIAQGDEEYSTTFVGTPVQYASVANDAALNGSLNYRTVIDGLSVHYRRDNDGPCDFTDGTTNSVDERLAEVLTFLGHEEIALNCFDPTAGTGIENPRVGPTFRTTLANFAPNPLMTGVTGRIQFTMSREGKAEIDIFDVNGRLVKSVFDGIAQEGPNEAFWNGSDESGRQVASGVYFYRLRANAEDFSKKMVVVRNGGN